MTSHYAELWTACVDESIGIPMIPDYAMNSNIRSCLIYQILLNQSLSPDRADEMIRGLMENSRVSSFET